jgi:hypothetical protein
MAFLILPGGNRLGFLPYRNPCLYGLRGES